MILLLISFFAGVLTAIAPCVLPLLPVIVGGSMAGGASSARGTATTRSAIIIAASLGISVIAFTLLLKASAALINVPQLFWELFSGAILVAFGLVMVFPALWDRLGFVGALNRSSNRLLAAGYHLHSLWGDALMGAALGPVFSSCSPTYFVILATVLPASVAMGLADLFAYALGLSGFLLLIALAGQQLVDRMGVAIEPDGWFRKSIGALFIIVGLAVATGAEASSEAWLLSHGFDLTFIEERLLGSRRLEAQSTSRSSPTGAAAGAGTTAASYLSLAQKALRYPKAPELASIDGYLNTGGRPVTIQQFAGKKVVLIDFWTYSCINCQREIPYLNLWQQKYGTAGLEIIGVSTPEFAFERVLGNVARAAEQLGITYPVVLDNAYGTWNAFGNQFWPRIYLIDIDGYIVYDHAGEGDYDVTERAIQKALAERSARLGADMPTFSAPQSPSGAVEVDSAQLGSPETYFGANRNEYLADGARGQTGDQTLAVPEESALEGNALYLGGAWTFSGEYATSKTAGAKIEYRYRAKNVYFVAAPSRGPARIRVTRDGGKPLGAARGKDVDVAGEATVDSDRLYQLVGDSSYGVHTLEIDVETPGLEAYTFTFG